MMKQSNFFQKKGVFIFLLTILGLVCCYFYFENQKETSLVSESESTTEPLFSEETPTLPRPKRSVKEPPIPQINTTAARLEQIKNYLFTEPANLSLLSIDLSEQEQEEIKKLKNSWGLYLGFLNRKKGVISKEQNKCDEYHSHLNLISPQIQSFEQQKLALEAQLEKKLPEVDRSKIDRKTNEAKIKKLQTEISEIVGEIGKINVEIKNLEATQRKYQDMLTRAEKAKKESEETYEKSEKEYINSIISKSNSLYEISSAEG
ncbi:MAG: effector [Sweet potato little leaf phytoplasma]|nr:effector [Sweet potato little leaf phytoplasma]